MGQQPAPAAERVSSILGCLNRSTASRSDCIWSNACSFGIRCTRQTSINWSKVRRGPPGWSRVEHLSCEERQREWGLFSLEKRRLWGDLIATSPYLSGSHHKDTARLITEVHNGRTRDSGKYRRIQLDTREKNSQTLEQAPRGLVQAPSLEVFKT